MSTKRDTMIAKLESALGAVRNLRPDAEVLMVTIDWWQPVQVLVRYETLCDLFGGQQAECQDGVLTIESADIIFKACRDDRPHDPMIVVLPEPTISTVTKDQ